MDELKVSGPGDVRRATLVVKLPEPQNGLELVVRLGAADKLSVLEVMGGIPSAGGADAAADFEETRRRAVASAGIDRRIAEMVLVEPAFSFEEREDGKAFWGDLTMANQAAVVREGLALSGWKGERPEGAKSFPPGAAGE